MTIPASSVLFVCHANICRSPLAHGVFVHLASEAGLAEAIEVDSAGTWAADGVAPHRGSQDVARQHGIDLAVAGTSRGLRPDDLQRFAHIIVMDRANDNDVGRLRRLSAFGPVAGGQAQVRLLRHITQPSATGASADVPDPVRGGPEDFARVYALIREGCEALLKQLAEPAARS